MEGVTLFEKERSSEIRKSLNIEPLLRIERSQLNALVMLVKCPRKDFPNKLCTCQSSWEKDQLDVLKLHGPIALRILDEIAGDFARAK